MNPSADDKLDEWLLSDEASQWLEEVRQSSQPVLQKLARLRKHLSAQQAHRVLELVELRERGRRKFAAADAMYFSRIGLEQATDQWIAAYKAERFRGRIRIADLCCGVGGDAMGLARVARELLVCDRHPGVALFAERNVVASGGTANLTPHAGDVAEVNLADWDAWYIDPDRRPSGSRSVHVEQHEPSDEVIDRLIAVNPHAAIKLAPACEVPARWAAVGELEWIGRGGECKQLVVWSGSLAKNPGERRATVLASNRDACQAVASFVGRGDATPDEDQRVGRFVFEPDAAVLASGLVGEMAMRHGWWTFASTHGYLTSDTRSDEPATSAFEVLDVLPFDPKKVAMYLRERGVGQLEIKHRAVDLSPERLRKELKLTGDNTATLLVTRVLEKRIAIVAKRIS